MPPIRLFGRKTLSGGDDLQIPCLLAIALRVVQLVALLVPIWNAIHRDIWIESDSENARVADCGELFETLLVSYAAASTVFSLAAFFTEVRLSVLSSTGTPTEPGDRSEKVEKLLEVKLVIVTILMEGLVVCGLGCALFVVNHQDDCEAQDPSVRASPQDDTTSATISTLNVADDMEDDFWRQMNYWFYSEYSSSVALKQQTPRVSLFGNFAWWWVALCFLWVTQVAEVVVAAALVLRLKCGSDESHLSALTTDSFPQPHHQTGLTEEMWEERCARLCRCLGMTTCFLFGGKEVALGDYGDVARALSDYLETGGVLDLVPSDIVMGFWVLQRLQRVRLLKARQVVVQQRLLDHRVSDTVPNSVPVTPLPSLPLHAARDSESTTISGRLDGGSQRRQTTYLMQQQGSETYYEAQQRKILSRRNEFDVEVLREGACFAKYALAIYTWMLYVYRNPVSGFPRLFCRSRTCCFSCRRVGSRRDGSCCDEEDEVDSLLAGEMESVVGDNCCRLHKSALLLHTGLKDADLVYAQLNNSFREIPYCIVVDHVWKTVVVAIRGTFSLEDCITDVVIEPEALDHVGSEFGFDGDGQHCHGGVLSCARIVHRDLERHGILNRLLLGSTAKYPGYSLRIVGHSLGAATATLLSYMMKERFPTLRCLSYSPPGMSLSWRMATDCRDFCTTYVLDSDLVPRLSLDTMEHLRDEVLDLIGRIKVPKIHVANDLVQGYGLLRCRLCADDDIEDTGEALQDSIDALLHNRRDIPEDSEYQRQLRDFRQVQSDRKRRRGSTRTVQLYAPGRIVHLIKTGERASCVHGLAKCLTCCTTNFGFNYTPVWVNNDDFNEIVVSPTMGTDHFPNRVCYELEGVAEDYGIDLSTSDIAYPFDVEQHIV